MKDASKRNRDERLQIMLSPEELRALDDFRFKFRVPSRAAAVRELLKRGLAAQATGAADDGSRSKDFGVLKTSPGSSFRDAATAHDLVDKTTKRKNARAD